MHLDGKEFEEIVLWRTREIDEPAKKYTLGRYGVMAVMIKGEWVPIRSLPDFEGVFMGGHQFIFDCKVSSASSFDLDPPGSSSSFTGQYKHMRKRNAYGVITFFLMHFNERKLKTKTDPEFTVAFPVEDNAFWQAYNDGSQKSISRAEAKMYGVAVDWDIPEGKKTLSPNLYKMLEALKAR